MADSQEMMDSLDARVARREGRRAFFTNAVGAAAIGAGFAFASAAQAQSVTDADILNFALNLEYLEANFYYFAVNGTAIPAASTTGTVGTRGEATGGRAVTFGDPIVAQYAREIAADELAHVNFLRSALGAGVVAQPTIDVGVGPGNAFSRAAQAAGLIPATAGFDVYANDVNFLLGSFIFEDVGVTAYKGAAPLLNSTVFLEAAAGLLAVEAYHAAIVRTTLYRKGIEMPSAALNPVTASEAISRARDSLDGAPDIDQGIAPITRATGVETNIVPLDPDGLAFSRTTGQVLNIVYLNNAAVTMGGFFPNGVNGTIRTSAAN